MSRSAPNFIHSSHEECLHKALNGKSSGRRPPADSAPRAAASRTTGPERTRMPHLPALARRARVLASLVGVLALVVALFATAGTAGAGTTPPAHPGYTPKPKPKPKPKPQPKPT